MGLDLDPVAVRVARANVQLNGVADRVRIVEGTLKTHDLTPNLQDRILVNILADVITALTPTLVMCLAHDGLLIASGIIEEQVGAVIDAFEQAALRIVERRQERDWVALIAAHNV